MTDHTLIADLIRNGVEADLVQRVVSALLSAAPAKPSKQDLRSERNRRYYENKRLKASETVLNSSATSELDASKTPPLPLSPSLPLSPQTPLSPAHPHAPTPASAHAPTCTREGPELKLEAETPAKPKAKQMSAADDAEWLAQLAQNPGYRGVDLAAELGRMQAWCQLKGKQPSRSRFLNWINRADRNLAPQRNAVPRRGAFDQARMTEGLTADQIGTL